MTPPMESLCVTPRRPWRDPSMEEPCVTPRGPCVAATRLMATMRGWRFASFCDHVVMALFRCYSNGFEASLHHDDHVVV